MEHKGSRRYLLPGTDEYGPLSLHSDLPDLGIVRLFIGVHVVSV